MQQRLVLSKPHGHQCAGKGRRDGLIFLHHTFMSAGDLSPDSKQPKHQVRTGKPTLSKDTGVSCPFLATSRRSDTEQVSRLAF